MKSDQGILNSFLIPKGFPTLPEDWNLSSETFSNASADGQLFSLRMKAEKPIKPYRVLFVVHGQGEHGGRYIHFPHFLKDTVSEVITFDLRGHGRSEGLRGHIGRFDDYTDDTKIFVERYQQKINAERTGTPVEYHLFGHSMGGLIALRLLFLHPELTFASATVSAPLLELKMHVAAIKKAAAYSLSRIWGNLQLTSELDPAFVCTDVNVQEAYAKDRLVHSKATPRFFVEMQEAMKDARARTSGIQTPLLFCIPMKDRIVDSDVTLAFAQALEFKNKEIRTYSDFEHESFNETEKETAFQDLKSWIVKNSKS